MGEVAKRAEAVLTNAAGNTVAPGVATLCVIAGMPIQEATAAGALAGALTQEMSSFVLQVRRDRVRRVERFAETMTEETGRPLDELLEAVAEHPEKLELLAQAVEGASRALHDAKVDLLSRIVVKGVMDDAKVDDSLIMMDAVRQLELPHLQLLAHLTTPTVPHREVRHIDVGRDSSGKGDVSVVTPVWRISQICERRPDLCGFLDGIAAKLQSLALIARQSQAGSSGGGQHDGLMLTMFGVRCAQYFRTRASGDGSDDGPYPPEMVVFTPDPGYPV